MASTDLVVRDTPRGMVQLSNDQLHYIANTDFVPEGLRGNVPAIMACVATGRALGIDDMSALRLIHLVNGRPTFSAELMVQLVRRYGHSIVGETKEGSCTVTGTRADNGDTMTVTWTLAMAQRAGLANKATWKAYPEALLWARAASQLCRQLFADCFAGATYTPEELEETESSGRISPDVVDPDGAPAAAVVQGALPEPDAGEPTAADPVAQATDAREPASPAYDDDAPLKKNEPMWKKLNVLVGTMREKGWITTDMLYRAMSVAPVKGDDGELHWSPLRDSLTRGQAKLLLDQLVEAEKHYTAMEGVPFS